MKEKKTINRKLAVVLYICILVLDASVYTLILTLLPIGGLRKLVGFSASTALGFLLYFVSDTLIVRIGKRSDIKQNIIRLMELSQILPLAIAYLIVAILR